MRQPTIHLNGSDAQSLFDGYYAALKAVQAAEEALAQCGPHGRDYYVQEATPGFGADATSEAMTEHRCRMAALHGVARDLELLALHVQANGKVRS